MPGQYAQVHEMRKKAGVAKPAPKENNSMTIDGNVVDLSDPDKMPKATPAPRSPIPQDDPYHKERVETT
jgi:hypothetical protein